jgi:two-component sensor histidine kinase
LDISWACVNASDGALMLYSIADITQRRRSDQQLRERTADLVASLKERDVLLQEIHHRVKNNLQVISSLINMQIRKLEVGASREVLKECKTRIEAISLIHQKLYQSTNFANVQFADYARSLAANVLYAADGAERIALEFAFEEIALPVDKAIPCGLILNELLTNVVKHAYPGQQCGTVRIALRCLPEKRVQLEVSDRGVGLSNPDPAKARRSIGLQLISTLAEQLQGELRIVVKEGTTVCVDFPHDAESVAASS